MRVLSIVRIHYRHIMDESALAQMVQRARFRQSRHRILSLKSLCLQAVADNLDFFKGKEHLFSYLPWTVMETFLQSHPESVQNPDSIEIVAQRQTLTLTLHFKPEHDFAEVCRRIQDECTNLRGLTMRLWYTNTADIEEKRTIIKIGALCALLRSLPQLQELKLRLFLITEEVLDAIASTCTQLRSLEIDYISQSRVSPEKLCQLIQKCTELEELKFDKVDNSVKRQALRSLKNLRVLFDYRGVETLLEEMSDEKPQLKLQEIILCRYRFADSCPVANLSEMLPNLQTLYMSDFPNVDPLLKFEHLTKIRINETPFSELLIQNYAAKLTHLDIENCEGEIDLSMLGYFCVNLEKLRIHVTDITVLCSYTLEPQHFSNLKHVHITLFWEEDESEWKPRCSSVMYRMLCSPKLNTFDCDFITLSHPHLNSLIEEALEGGVVFSQLENFTSYVKDFSASLAIQLACAMPKLKEINFYMMCDVELKKLSVFLDTNFPHIVHNTVRE